MSGIATSPQSDGTLSTEAEAETSETLTLRIEGMDCACEGQLLEREFGGVPGVTRYDVDVVAQKAHVTYDPSRATTQDILRSVSATGRR